MSVEVMGNQDPKKEFDGALEALKHAHNQKDLEIARQRVFKARDNLLAVSEKFRKEHEERRQESAARVEMIRHSAKINGAMRKSNEAKNKAVSLRREYDPWMKNPYLRKINREILDRESKIGSNIGLACPQCGGKDHGNKHGKKPWCLKCNVQLISKVAARKFGGNNRIIRKISNEKKMKGWHL